jgi:hypothetical protein
LAGDLAAQFLETAPLLDGGRKGLVMNIEMIGYGVSVLGAFPLLGSGVMFTLHHPTVVENMTHLNFELGQMRALGLAKIAVAILTLIPATSFVGVVLATGWVGGAIAAHLRVHDKFVIQTIVPIMIWIGFALRHADEMRQLLNV